VSRICHILGDSKYGGGSKVVLGLCERAMAAGHDLTVLTTDPRLGGEVERMGGRVVRLDCIRRPVRPLRDLRGLVMLVRHLRRERYDLVHTHTTKAGMIGRLACKLAGVGAVVHTVHGFAFHERSRRPVVFLIASLERVAATWCDRLVTVSRFHREWALRLRIADERKIVAIPNSIEPIPEVTADRRREVRDGLGVRDDEFLVLGLGRLAEQKGFRDLVAAAPAIRERAARAVKFRIAGDGPSRAALQQATVELGVGDAFGFVGFSADVAGLLGAADLVVQPSLWEGYSISLLEAMSAGKAIVTTSIASNVEIVGESGCAILVPASDPTALAAVVVALINDDKERLRLADSARDVFREEHRGSRMQDEYVRLYERLLAARGGATEGMS